MPQLSKQSIKVVDNVIEYLKIKENQKFYNQGTFGSMSNVNPCETECCIAGIIHYQGVGAKKHNKLIQDTFFTEAHDEIHEYANNKLRLENGDFADTENLFNIGSFWKFGLGNEFYDASTDEQQIKVAIKRLEVFKILGE